MQPPSDSVFGKVMTMRRYKKLESETISLGGRQDPPAPEKDKDESIKVAQGRHDLPISNESTLYAEFHEKGNLDILTKGKIYDTKN